jgi:hypothetical protein
LNALAKTVTFEQTKKKINVESALSSWIERRRDKKKEKSHTHTPTNIEVEISADARRKYFHERRWAAMLVGTEMKCN